MRLQHFSLYTREPQWVLRNEVRVCDHCDRAYPVYGLTSRFCSKRCRQAAWRRATRLCKFCKKRFRLDHRHVKTQLYCSRTCYFRGVRQWRPPLAEQACAECGVRFVPGRHNHSRQIYCSTKCKSRVSYRNWSARKRAEALGLNLFAERACEECGALYTPDTHNHARQIYCSIKCRNRVNSRNFAARKRMAARLVPMPLPAGLIPSPLNANNLVVLPTD
jgi:hypothetical protein